MNLLLVMKGEFAHVPSSAYSIFLIVLGLTGVFLAVMGMRSCTFLEVTNGSVDGLDFSGTAGLLRFANDTGSCINYDDSVVNDDVNFQIASFSAWGAPISAFIGVSLSLVHTFVMPGCSIFIMLSYGCAFTFICLSFFIRQTSICDGDCSISTGAYYSLAALGFVVIPGLFIMCVPAPMGAMAKGMVNHIEDDMAGDIEGESPEDKKKRKNKNEMKMIRMAMGDPTSIM